MSPNIIKPSFDGNNYFQYKEEMVIQLLVAECKEAIDEETTKTAADKKINNKALGMILQSIEPHIRADYQEETSAFVVWGKLKTTYGTKSRAILEKLEQEYATLTYTTFEETIARFKGLVSAMKQCEIVRDEEILCLKLMKTLPPTWKGFTDGLKTREKLTLSSVLSILQTEYQENKQLYDASPRERANIIKKSRSGPFEGMCYVCGNKGHKAYQCPEKKIIKKPSSSYSSAWFIDSCASSHMTPFKSHFVSYKPVKEQYVVVADGSSLKVLGIGNVVLKDKTRHGQNMLLKDVLHVEGLQDCLISVAKLNMDGIDAEFRNMDCHLHKNGQLLAKGEMGNGIFQLQDRAMKITETDIWHHRFGHTSNAKLANMVKKNQITDVTIRGKESFCDSCARGKAFSGK